MSEEPNESNGVRAKIDLSRLRKRRSANRNVVRGFFGKAKELMKNPKPESKIRISALLQSIVNKEKGLHECDKHRLSTDEIFP